jgi:hypothetical protein
VRWRIRHHTDFGAPPRQDQIVTHLPKEDLLESISPTPDQAKHQRNPVFFVQFAGL